MLESYLKPYQLPDTLVADYLTAMNSVIRFGHPEQTRLGLDFRETDAMHIEQCLTLATDLFDACPHLSTFLQGKHRDTIDMLLIHELGEPFAGDRPRSFTDPSEIPSRGGQYVLKKKEKRKILGVDMYLTDEQIKKIDNENFKNFEHACFRLLVLPHMPPEYRERAYNLYMRIESPKLTDVPAQIANFIDRYDGIRTYTSVYLAHDLRDQLPDVQISTNRHNIELINQQLKSMNQLLPQGATRQEFTRFWKHQIKRDFPSFYLPWFPLS